MKVKFVFVIIFLSALFPACKKGNVFSGAKVDQATDFIHQYILTYTYNSTTGNVTNIQKNTLGDTTFSYNGNTVIQSGGENSTDLLPLINYHINSSGVADTAQGEGYLRDYMSTYIYDDNGEVTQQKVFTSNVLQYVNVYTNVNRNVTEIQHVTGSGVTTWDYFTYLTSNTNTVGVQNYGKNYLGVDVNNLISTDVKIGSNLDTTDIITYHYYYNGSNYVDTLASWSRTGQLLDSMAFTYY